MNWNRARMLRLFSPNLVKSAGGSLTSHGSRPRLCIPSGRGSGGSTASRSTTSHGATRRDTRTWEPAPPSAAPSGVPRTRESEAAASKGPRGKERLGFFITTIIILPPPLPPRCRLIFPRVAAAASPRSALLVRVPASRTCLAGDDRAALLTGSGSELLPPSRGGAHSAASVPGRPIHYLLAPAPQEPSGRFKRGALSSRAGP